MKKDLISIIIPVYNSERYIRKCVKSIINQTYKNTEIILINDGSTDNSAKICDEFCHKYSSIIFVNQKHIGVSAARNKGIKIASGEYISFIDSDDWVTKSHYEMLIHDIKKHKADFACSRFRFVHDTYHFNKIKCKNTILVPANEVYIYTSYVDAVNDEGFGESSIYGKLFKTSIVNSPNQLFYDESLCLGEDFIWLSKYIERSNNASMNFTVSYFYRKNKEQVTSSASKEDWLRFSEYKIKYLSKIHAPNKAIQNNIELYNSTKCILQNQKVHSNHESFKLLYILQTVQVNKLIIKTLTKKFLEQNNRKVHYYMFTINTSKSKWRKIWNLIFLNNFLIDNKDHKRILNLLNNNSYKYVFLESSIYGNICKAIHRSFPEITIITQFQKNEIEYWKSKIKDETHTLGKIFLFFSLFVIKKSEKKSAKYSDYWIFTDEKNKNTICEKYTSKKIILLPNKLI